MSNISPDQRCVRCGKQVPGDSDDLRYWECLVSDADDIICPRCRELEWKIPGAHIDSRFSRIRPEW